MAGTQAGGRKAAATNKQRYGDGKNGRIDFYREIGSKGGKTRGGLRLWQLNHELARVAGSKGGSSPRRRKSQQ